MQSSSSNYFSNGGGDGGSPHMGGMGPSSHSATFIGKGPLVLPPIPSYRDLHNKPRPRDPRDAAPSPSSVAGSSDGAGLNSDSGYDSLNGIEKERILHTALEKFFSQDLVNDRIQKRKPVWDNLLRLSKLQFQELATDVYDELQRRQLPHDTQGSSTPSYLLPKESLHPKRNQARMNMSTVTMAKFRDLAKDVLYELERRYPHFQDLIIL